MSRESETGCLVATVVGLVLCCAVPLLLLGGTGVGLAALSGRSLALGAAGVALVVATVWWWFRRRP
jgi:nitrate reductase gamma subunit